MHYARELRLLQQPASMSSQRSDSTKINQASGHLLTSCSWSVADQSSCTSTALSLLSVHVSAQVVLLRLQPGFQTSVSSVLQDQTDHPSWVCQSVPAFPSHSAVPLHSPRAHECRHQAVRVKAVGLDLQLSYFHILCWAVRKIQQIWAFCGRWGSLLCWMCHTTAPITLSHCLSTWASTWKTPTKLIFCQNFTQPLLSSVCSLNTQ